MFRHSLLACLVIVLSAQAHAAALPFTAFLDLHIGVQVAHLEGAGIAGVSATGVEVPASFAATTAAIVPIQASVAAVAFPIVGLQITARNGAGAFLFDSQGGLGAAMPYQGAAKVYSRRARARLRMSRSRCPCSGTAARVPWTASSM